MRNVGCEFWSREEVANTDNQIKYQELQFFCTYLAGGGAALALARAGAALTLAGGRSSLALARAGAALALAGGRALGASLALAGATELTAPEGGVLGHLLLL